VLKKKKKKKKKKKVYYIYSIYIYIIGHAWGVGGFGTCGGELYRRYFKLHLRFGFFRCKKCKNRYVLMNCVANGHT